MDNKSHKKDFIYSQGLANLRLEGMSLTSRQEKIAQDYQTGKLSNKKLIAEALKYARS